MCRSYIYLDGELIADNSGLHGMVQKCGKRNIGAGSHSFKVTGFQGGGGVGQHVRYSGPDTGGVTRWLRSTKAKYNAHGEPTKFSMCIFQAGYALSSVPWLGSLAYVGVGQMPVVNLNSAEDFRQVRFTSFASHQFAGGEFVSTLHSCSTGCLEYSLVQFCLGYLWKASR